MSVPVVRIGLCAAALLLTQGPLWSPAARAAEVCSTTELSSFSRLGAAIRQARAKTPGKLLATWLLRSTDPGSCRFIFRIDLLLDNGRVLSMNFDAKSLDEVDIDDERNWVDADASGAGGEATGVAGATSGSESDDRDAETESESETHDSADSSDSDSSDSGGGDDGGGGDGGGGDGGGGDD